MANNNNIYIIPENFIDGGRIINGMFRTRNFIEAVIISFIIGFPLWMINYPSFQIKAAVLIIFVMPVFLIAAIGINDNSLVEFLQQFFKWKNNKRVMIFNGQTRSRAVRPADVVLAQELPKDKIVSAIDTWKENKRQKNANITYIEGEDFVFMDDDDEKSLFLSTEKRLIQEKEMKNHDESKKTNRRRKKKTKENMLLMDKNKIHNDETVTESDSENNLISDNDLIIVPDEDIDVENKKYDDIIFDI